MTNQERLISAVQRLVLALNAQAPDQTLTLTATAMFVATVLAACKIEQEHFIPMLESAIKSRQSAGLF